MTFKEVFTTLTQNKYYVFSYGELLSFFPSARKNTLKQALYRWRKNGWIEPLKKGMYAVAYPHRLDIPDLFIANRLYAPSYVSLETALSHYSIIPEVAMAVTSVTTKPSRRMRNSRGLFIYRSVKEKCFNGYHLEKVNGYDIAIAEPEKALADYLYFKTYRNKKTDIRGERLDKNIIAGLNRKKIKDYCAAYGLDAKEILYAQL